MKPLFSLVPNSTYIYASTSRSRTRGRTTLLGLGGENHLDQNHRAVVPAVTIHHRAALFNWVEHAREHYSFGARNFLDGEISMGQDLLLLRVKLLFLKKRLSV